MADHCCSAKGAELERLARQADQRRVLIVVLIINAVMFVAEFGAWRFRAQDVNMASTWECSRNDVFSNVGVLIAAGLVAATASPWPDIVIGLVMAAVVLRSAVRVLNGSVPQLKAQGA